MNYKQMLNRAKKQSAAGYHSAAGNGRGRGVIPSGEDKIVIRMKLADGGVGGGGYAKIFGALNAEQNATDNSANNVVITSDPEAYEKIIQRLKMGAFFRIGGASLAHVNATQGSQKMKIITSTGFGSENARNYLPSSSKTSKDNDANFLDMVDFQLKIDESTQIEYNIDQSVGESEVTLTLFIIERFAPSAMLDGRPAVEESRMPNTGVLKERLFNGRV